MIRPILNLLLCAILISCVTTKQPSVLDFDPELFTKQYTPQQINEIRAAFKNDPSSSQEYGNVILWQMHKKSPEFAMAMAELPDIVDGIDANEAVAMAEIYQLIEPIDIPNDLYAKTHVKPEGYQSLIITWTGNSNTPTKFFGNFSRHSKNSKYGYIISFSPSSFEQGDTIDYDDFRKSGSLTFNSYVDKSDTDILHVELIWNGKVFSYFYEDRHAEPIQLYLNKLIKFHPEEVKGRVKIFDEKDGIEGKVTIRGEATPGGLSEEQNNIKDLVLFGLGEQRYSAPLEALLWGYMDGSFNGNPLNKYDSMIAMTKDVWGNIKGERWETYTSVNHPVLFEYFMQQLPFRYKKTYYPKYALDTFKDGHGDCKAYAIAAYYCLTNTGTKGTLYTMDPRSPVGHTIC